MKALLATGLLAAEGGGGSPLSILPAMLIIMVLFYFFFIRSESKKRARHEEMLKQLKKNDRVMTIGGIYGTVAGVSQEKDEVVLRVDENNNTKIRVSRSAIARVIQEEESRDS